MKRLFKLFYSLLLVTTFISCEKPMFPDNASSGNDDKANLIVTLYQIETEQFPGAKSRAIVTDYCTRLNFAVYDSLNTRVGQVNQVVGDKDFGTAHFKVEPGKYRVVVVGHSSNGNPTMTNPSKIQFKNKDGFTDTFLSNDTVVVGDSEKKLPVNINRIVALCRFVITDSIPSKVAQMRFQYKGGSGAFDAATGLGCVKSTQTEFFPIESDQESNYFDLYTFLPDKEGEIHLQATAYDEDNNVVCDNEFDVPLKRRLITKLSGPYFSGSSGSSGSTSGITIIIGINADWEGEQVINY